MHADEMISSICLHNPHTHRGKMHPEHSFNHRALKAEVLSVRSILTSGILLLQKRSDIMLHFTVAAEYTLHLNR